MNQPNRIEKVRKYVDCVLVNMTDPQERRCAYLHLYGVSQACALLALKRGENVELATIAGMLHDLHSYMHMYTTDHAQKGALLADEILTDLTLFTTDEIERICKAIHNHSDKSGQHSAFDEVLIDADVLQHCLYNPLMSIAEHEKDRFTRLKTELSLL